eukprot:403340210
MESSQIRGKYFIDELIEYINQRPFKNIALQFPDSMLVDSVDVYMILQKHYSDRYFYVLGDTSFGECCIDDVNASHLNSNDLIIHFGKCCLSTASKSPTRPDKEVLYVIPNSEHINPPETTISELQNQISNILQTAEQPTLVFIYSDINCYLDILTYFSQNQAQLNIETNGYQHRLVLGLIDTERFTIIPQLDKEDIVKLGQLEGVENKVSVKVLGRNFQITKEEQEKCKNVMVYVENLDLSKEDVQKQQENADSLFINTLMANTGTNEYKSLYSFNLNDQTLVEISDKQVSRQLMQRYNNIEKIREAQVIGILVGTVAVDNYMDIINNLKIQIVKQGKKYYEVLIGKLNEPKLKNFQFVNQTQLMFILFQIDLYVIVGCPETSLVPFRKFNMTVVTPHELLMALEEQNFPWESRIITDFNQILQQVQDLNSKFDNMDLASHQPVVDESQLALVKKEHQELIPIFSSQVIQRYENLSYKGLEISNEKTEVEGIKQGLIGIATMQYRDIQKTHLQKVPFFLKQTCYDSAKSNFRYARMKYDNQQIEEFLQKWQKYQDGLIQVSFTKRRIYSGFDPKINEVYGLLYQTVLVPDEFNKEDPLIKEKTEFDDEEEVQENAKSQKFSKQEPGKGRQVKSQLEEKKSRLSFDKQKNEKVTIDV